VIFSGYSIVKPTGHLRDHEEVGMLRHLVGKSTIPQIIMDVIQYPFAARGIMRWVKREHINEMATAMLTGEYETKDSRRIHMLTKGLLEKNQDATHVVIRGKTPVQTMDTVVVEVPSPRSITGRLAARAYAKHGYRRHVTGEGKLILSREDVMESPLSITGDKE